MRLFKNPFDYVIGTLPSDLLMKIIDLQSSDIFKDKFKEGILWLNPKNAFHMTNMFI